MISTSAQPSVRRRASMAYCSFWLSRLFNTWYGDDRRTYKIALREMCCGLILSLITSPSFLRGAIGTAGPRADEQLRQQAYYFDSCLC
jgi:hypothetical protein